MNSSDAPVMLVCGGTGSIGGEIAAQAAAAGWRVVVHGSGERTVASALERLVGREPGGCFRGVAANIATRGDVVAELVSEAHDHFGRLDAVVDCLVTGPAGIAGRFEETRPKAFGEFAELSIVYLERLAHAALPRLKHNGGCLVTLISDAGLFAAPHQTLIGAARAASVGFVRNLAMEVAADGVRVHCISPSYVEETRIAEQLRHSSFQRLEKARKRAGLGLPTPADIAPLVLFLCGDGARRITGQVISVNGGVNA